nr:hypothetical protein [Mesorhizobium onobrychidis]
MFLINLRSMSPDFYDLLESEHSGGFVVSGPKDYAMAAAIVRLASGNGR